MPKLQLNKANLTRKTRDLKNYKQFLPSLDMKRKQLLALQKKTEKEYGNINEDLKKLMQNVGEKLPMLANDNVDLRNLVRLESIDLDQEKIMGVTLPLLRNFQISVKAYSYFSWPHWVDNYINEIRGALELSIKHQIWQQRVEILKAAVLRATQKVNLFDKVLIPKTQSEIAKIKVYISDLERAAVVTSKIAKNKRKVM